MTSMPNRSSKHAQRGYSLAEVLIAVAVFTVIFVATLMVYDRANRVFKSGVDASDVQQTTRVAFEKLVADLRMAGFDYDRDGYPMGAKKYQQPDEQLEFIHPHAITIRTNLNYESAAANDNGRETAYEPGFTTTATDVDDFFPIVTTANNEIVTYALQSDTGPNPDAITFFIDKRKPRRTYPEPTAGGVNEEQVTIRGVNLCVGGCLNPPYTLVRIALKDDGTGTQDVAVPIANNIRSVNFSYFADALSSVAVTPNGGVGAAVVIGGSTPAASVTARELRGGIRSIVVNLVGMSPGRDPNYREPIEAALPPLQQVASAARHRQYRLESTVVPRNLGKRGVQEMDTRVPGAPRITQVCAEGCGVPRVEWEAPAVGYVDSYVVIFDTTPGGAFNSATTDAGRNLFAYVDKDLNPATPYHFRVIAKNAFGSAMSDPFPMVGTGIRPINRTKPMPPTILSVTGNAAGPASVPNDIIVTWRAPSANVTPLPPNSCGNPVSAVPTVMETRTYKVYRDTSSGFTPVDSGSGANLIWTGSVSALGPAVMADPNTGIVTFTDSTLKRACLQYFYKVVGVERCFDDDTFNFPVPPGKNLGISNASAEMAGEATAGGNPQAPQNVRTTIASSCSATTCSIALEWNEVTLDVNNKPILVSDYVVRRQTYTGGVLTATAAPILVNDAALGNGVVNYTDAVAAPPAGAVYHYAVTANQCNGAFVSDFSTPDAKFPCSIITVTPDASTLVEGDGSAANPWVIGTDTALARLETNVDISTATAVFYDVSAPTVRNPAVVTVTGTRTRNFTFSMPGTTGVFGIDMQLTDVTGCGTTITRYFQESPTSCCLLPYKFAGGAIFDPTILTLAGNAVTVTLKNQCGLDLTVDTFGLRWTFGPAGNDLESITYPGGIVETFFPPLGTGSAVLNPRTVSAPLLIPANGEYRVTLRFQRNATTLNTITNFCALYTPAGALSPLPCGVAQEPSQICP